MLLGDTITSGPHFVLSDRAWHLDEEVFLKIESAQFAVDDGDLTLAIPFDVWACRNGYTYQFKSDAEIEAKVRKFIIKRTCVILPPLMIMVVILQISILSTFMRKQKIQSNAKLRLA